MRNLYDGEGDLASRTAHILYVFVLAKYWTRVWIIQEILLARALVFRVGPVRASPNALLALYSDLDRLLGRALLEFFESVGRSSESFVPPGLRDHQVWPLYHTYSLIKQWDDNAGANDGAWQPRAIADVFTSFPSQACSLAHDKIYGLLGLTDSVCRVNYAASTLELFLRLLIESTFAPVSLGYLEGSNNHDHHLCIALLSGLGLRVEAPAVHYAILRGLDLCGVRAATTPMTYRPLLHRIQRSARLHPRLIPAYANALQALTEHRVRFHQRFRNLRLPAVDTFETRSLDELDRFVCDIFEDVQAQILCARRHYRFRMLAASAWKPEDRPWRYVYLPAE